MSDKNKVWSESACTLDHNRNINLILPSNMLYKIPKSTKRADFKLNTYKKGDKIPYKIIQFMRDNNSNTGISVEDSLNIIKNLNWFILEICDSSNETIASICGILINIYQYNNLINSHVTTHLCVKLDKRCNMLADMIIREYLIYLDKIKGHQHSFYITPKAHHTCSTNVKQWIYPLNIHNLQIGGYGAIDHKHMDNIDFNTIRPSIEPDGDFLKSYTDKIVIDMHDFVDLISIFDTYTIINKNGKIEGIFAYHKTIVKKDNMCPLNFINITICFGNGYKSMINYLYKKYNKTADAIFGYCLGYITEDIVIKNNGFVTKSNQTLEIHGASIDIKASDYFGIII